MPRLSRADTSLVGRWWWTVDRLTLLALGLLIGFGYVMMLAASPAVAARIGEARDALILKQVLFLALAAAIMTLTSFLSLRGVRNLALMGGLLALALTALTLIKGVEIKGARRWIALPGFSLQPSEFLKPFFAVLTGYLLTTPRLPRLAGGAIATLAFALIAFLLKSQPDIGMLSVITAVFLAQWFIAGLNLILVGVGLAGMAGGGIAAYAFFPHVQSRVARFLDPAKGDHYQITTALEAFGNGGLWGRGPGEGRIKDLLPDAHADFVFAVAGEEFGFVICAALVGLFAFLVIRGLLRLKRENDPFVVVAASGLLAGFGLQAFINMASSLHLIPTKGMTLPFISYGGSSVLAMAFGMGMLLALTRRRFGGEIR
jgi:cell division protein FtsW